MKKLFFITIITATLALSGCVRHCIGFPNDMLRLYFPYSTGQTITFVDDSRDTVSINVTDMTLSRPYTLEWNVKEECTPTSNIKMSGIMDKNEFELNFNIILHSPTEQNDEDWTTNSSIMFTMYTYFNSPSAHNAYTFLDTTALFPSANIRGLYDSIILIGSTTTLESNIDTLVMVKNKGLAGFSTSDGRKYVLTE